MKRILSAIAASLLAVAVSSADERPLKLLVIGDSTASEYQEDVAPRKGWAQMLQTFFDPGKVEVIDGARSGRSSKSYYEEGWWKDYLGMLGKGDYVLIQFGHNDQKPDEKRHTDPATTYKEWLTRYITEARAKEVTPVLLTSIHRNHWSGNAIKDSHGDYPPAVRELAQELDIPLIDMHSETGTLFEKLGPEKTKEIFLILEAGEHPNYPDGVTDNTHLREYGARTLARMVAAALKKTDLPVSSYVEVD